MDVHAAFHLRPTKHESCLRVGVRANFQPCFGQCLNDAFSYLLGFLDSDILVRTFFEALIDRRRNYRNHLMLIYQLPTLRVAQIVYI
jgi:hypothetical protein